MREKNALLFIFWLVFIGHGASLVFPPYLHSYGIRKATPRHLFMFFGPVTSFDNPQGLATTKMISRDDPKTINDDDEVIVYGVNAGRNQLIYNTSMYTLALYGGKGPGRDQFNQPRGIAAEPHGNVFVADSGNNRIVHLFNPRKEARWVRAFYGKIKGDKGFNGPQQVAVDEKCLVYVTDTKNHRIVIFDTTEKKFMQITGDGTNRFEDGPTTLAVADGSSRWSYFRRERLLFCADKGGTRLWKIDSAGIVQKTVMVPEGYHAYYGAIDYYHNFYVTDMKKCCILKYDHNLSLLDIFGACGEGDNQFVEPRGIAIYKRYGQTFVAEKAGAQYYWIGTGIKSKKVARTGDSTMSITANVTEYSYLSLFYAAGKDTIFFLKRKMLFPGGAEAVAFAKGKGSVYNKPGRVLTLRIEPTYSSYTYYSWDYPVTITK